MEQYAILGNMLNIGLLKLMDRTQFIANSLATNSLFSKTVQTLGLKLKGAVSLLKGKNDLYELTPTALNKQLRDEARQAVEGQLRAILDSVNTEATGNLDKLVSSGFELNHAKHIAQTAAAAPSVIELFVHPLELGAVDYKIARVEKVSQYRVEYRAQGTVLWQSVTSGVKGRITHLESVTQYEFRAGAMNAYSKKHNEYNYSPLALCVAQ